MADFTHRMTLSINEKQSRISVFADSWLKYNRMKSVKLYRNTAGNFINLGPHKVELENGYKMQTAMMDNFSVGGMTMDSLLEDENVIQVWGENLPKITIIHLGACDLANEPIGRDESIALNWPKKLKNFINKLKSIARGKVLNKSDFDTQIQKHTFLVIGIPSWGDFGQGHYDYSLNSNDHAKARKKANNGVRSNLKSLYEEQKVVVFTPMLDYPFRHGVHLTGISLEVYTDQILQVASKIMCTHCTRSSAFIIEEHKSQAEGSCMNQQHQ